MSLWQRGNSLVPVNKGVILREAFPKCACLFNQVSIVADLRAKERRFDEADVTTPGRTAVPSNLVGVHVEDLNERQVQRHFASRSRSRSN